MLFACGTFGLRELESIPHFNTERAEDPYKFFNWNVTHGDICPLGVRQRGPILLPGLAAGALGGGRKPFDWLKEFDSAVLEILNGCILGGIVLQLSSLLNYLVAAW
ncbi:hypothetical protein KIW84_012876 [Lathyrus oleraceus]|uniref:Uncharacterized protein n=1 Tax=Pisum sativum TaxID=3888 RepID=A0A9D5BIL6_PEA|nr:hypothetical protein KIW84_012876 [Pisum sativum]